MHNKLRLKLRNKFEQFKKNLGFGVHHLVSKHEHSLKRELPTAIVEQVLEARTKKINHHHIILPLNAVPLQVWNASCNETKRGAKRSAQLAHHTSN